MSYNKAYQDRKSCTSVDEFDICKQKKQQKILLKCGQGTGSKTFVSPDDNPFQIANVTVDTTCLKKPEVLIKFSSLVRTEKIENGPKTARLKYELFRTCNGGIVFKETGLPIPADIAHVTIDMTRLVKPKVLIEFSCIIKLAEDVDDALFMFELFRLCGDSEPVSRGTWTFETRNQL